MKAPPRVSKVGAVKLNSIRDASVAQFGDSDSVKLFNRAIAVQRAIPRYWKDETRFAAYPIFFRPKPIWEPAVDRLNVQDPCGEIEVGTLDIASAGSSSLIRIGSGGTLTAESRIKHFRHFNNKAGLSF